MNAAKLFAVTFLFFGAGIVSGCTAVGEVKGGHISGIPLPFDNQPCIEYTLKNGRRVQLCYLDPVAATDVMQDALSPLPPIY